MPSSNLKEKIREAVRSKLRERSQKKRKKTEGHVNIAGVKKPKKHNPKAKKQETKAPAKPASVSVGAHGGQYVLEPSGHKKYIAHGSAAGRKKIAKSMEETIKEIVLEDRVREFVDKFKRNK